MSTPDFWLLLSLLAMLMLTLAWVGLRFFCPSEGPARRPNTSWRAPLDRFSWGFVAALLAPFGSRQALWLPAALLLAGLTVTTTLTLSRFIDPPPMTGGDIGPTIAAGDVLGEEVLAPPQPLPPSVFLGTDSFDLEHADRDWNRLDARFRNCLLQLLARMETRGYPMALLEGYRSHERQKMLAAKGPSVTHAVAGQSRHQFGLAADLAPMRYNRLRISERDPWAAVAYQILGEEAGRLGLVWGGSWAMRDLGHVEHTSGTASLPKQPAS